MKIAIVGGGVVDNYSCFAGEISKYDLIICADGGIRHLMNVGIPPHIFIGDFDSCNIEAIVGSSFLADTEIISHDPVKDDTDMQLCIDKALESDCEYITLFAALGGRVDHELSNIYNLVYILNHGVSAMIYSESNRIYITNDYLKVQNTNGYKLSVISLTDKSEGVTLRGLYYPLDNATVFQGTSLGISNEFVDEYAEIYVKNGTLLVTVSKDTVNH